METEQKWVLIVDDEEQVALSLEETLRTMGDDLAAISVGSAEEALEQFAHHPFDLLVTDLRMPGMDGLELIRRVRDSHPHVPAILITAYGSDETEIEIQHLRLASYLTKPFRITEFMRVVEQALRLKQPDRTAPSPPPGQAKGIERVLTTLRRATGAQCLLLADRKGRLLAQVGSAKPIPLERVLSVLAEEIAITTRMNRYLRGQVETSMHHYEGERHRIYAAVATDGPLLVVVMNQQGAFRQSGVTWLFLRRALHELRRLSRQAERRNISPPTATTPPPGDLTPAQAQALGLSEEPEAGEGSA